MKFSVILGTRPELIKLSLIIKKLRQSAHNVDIVFTGQHYDYSMSTTFIEELEWPEPDFKFNCVSSSHAEQTADILIAVEKYLQEANPDIVIVLGDTNTTLAGALAASKLGISVAHIEAGSRCFDMKMPEEINRCIVDTISSLFFAPTEICVRNLLREGIDHEKITMVGSMLREICRKYLKSALDKSGMLKKLGIKEKKYALLTMHRQENADVKENSENILNALPLIKTRIVFPIHPRTSKRLKEFGLLSQLKESPNVLLIDPIGHSDFLALLSRAQVVMTDSGGVQEESAIVHVPCVTLRNTTELWETIEAGANVLVGTDKDKIIEVVNNILDSDDVYNRMANAEVYSPMNSSELILEKLFQFCGSI